MLIPSNGKSQISDSVSDVSMTMSRNLKKWLASRLARPSLSNEIFPNVVACM